MLPKKDKRIIINSTFQTFPVALELITPESAKDNKFIHLLSQWRRNVLIWIPSDRQITLNGTKEWLQKRVIEQPDRILFIVKVNDRYVGHVGLCHIDNPKSTAELDNIIRGEKGYPGIMEYACRELMNWGQEALQISSYRVQTSSDNIRALTLYSKLGFVEEKRLAVIRIPTKGGERLELAPEGYQGEVYRFRIWLNKPS